MVKPETVEVPFTQFGNRRGFTRQQLEDDPIVWTFFQRFEYCFERDFLHDCVIFIEPTGGDK